MRKLILLPAILSSLLLAAHFLRAENLPLCGAFVLLPLLLLIRRRWATRLVQFTLLAGAIIWLWTMVDLAETFRQIERPSDRMIVIMTSVAAFTAASAALLQLIVPGPVLGNSEATRQV